MHETATTHRTSEKQPQRGAHGCRANQYGSSDSESRRAVPLATLAQGFEINGVRDRTCVHGHQDGLGGVGLPPHRVSCAEASWSKFLATVWAGPCFESTELRLGTAQG